MTETDIRIGLFLLGVLSACSLLLCVCEMVKLLLERQLRRLQDEAPADARGEK